MITNKNLGIISKRVQNILRNELKRSGIECKVADVTILPFKSVGVAGDSRTYTYLAELDIRYANGRPMWRPDVIARISNRIVNDEKYVGRVVYLLRR